MDVMILYESKNREIENASLLASELKKRNCKVCIKNIYSPFKYFVKPKLLIVPHLYDDEQLISFGKNFWLKNDAILDLQYEQILEKNVDPQKDIHSPKGQARFAHHIAWGEDQAKRYRICGIPESNIHVTGSMSMDLMKDHFAGYFYSKNQLADEYSLDASKEWVLFISSFSYANRTEKELQAYEQMFSGARKFSKLSEDSLSEILNWLEKAAIEFPNKIFIYRPHPAEKVKSDIWELTKKLPNFYCIADYSMRQWARVVDRVYNWYSTSIADIYFAKKTCFILRPYEIQDDIEVSILDDAKKIDNLESFLLSLQSTYFSFPLTDSVMEYYYGNSNGNMAYQKIANVCENLLNGSLNTYHFDFGKNRFDMCNLKKIHKIFINWLNLPFYVFCRAFRVSKIRFLSSSKNKLLMLYEKDIYGYEKAVKSYMNRFNKMI